VAATAESIALTTAAARAAADKLAEDIVAFDVSEQLAIADVFLLCSAPNDRQVSAVVDAVEETLAGLGSKPARREGQQQGRWILLDYLDVVVHVLLDEDRAYYSLERLWRDCPAIPLPVEAEAGR
jgi:ribosome-associated protein